MRCRGDAPKPPEENPAISGTSSGHLSRQGKKMQLTKSGDLIRKDSD
jgi:hypothetical protein